jgi:hypothetical protein
MTARQSHASQQVANSVITQPPVITPMIHRTPNFLSPDLNSRRVSELKAAIELASV